MSSPSRAPLPRRTSLRDLTGQIIGSAIKIHRRLAIPGITIAGAAAVDYSQTNNCGSNIGAGQSCTVTAKFTPTKTGARNATLEVNDDGGGSPQKASLAGTGN